jgi:hypothetical protein
LLCGPYESATSLTDTTVPILLVEGLKKLAAAWRLSRWDCNAPHFFPCGLSGVWNFRGNIGKSVNATGRRVDLKGVIPDFDRVVWDGRQTIIAYDSDALTNPSVGAAREALAEELRERGARVVVLYLPALDGLEKTGLDDLLARWGPQAVFDWIRSGQKTATEVEDDPEPILLDVFDRPPYPTGRIQPPWLRDMIAATAAATETPNELPLLLALGAVATCVQRTFVIEPEPGYLEPTNIWAVAALDSGMRKTEVLRKITAPLYAFEREYNEAHASEIAALEARRRLAEDRIKHLRQRAARAEGTEFESLRLELLAEEASLPEVPKPRRLWAQDVTSEQLGRLMSDHNEKISILSDEGGIFDILAGRYSNGIPNLDLFLQGYSGAPYRVDRGSRPPVFMERPALTLVLCPQPPVLRGLAAVPAFRGRGLLARPLYALPASTLGHRSLTAQPIPDTVRSAYWQGLYKLLQLPPPQVDQEPHGLRFSDPAREQWKDFQRHVEEEMQPGRNFEHITDWASKLPGNLARVAALLHCAEHANSTPQAHLVSSETIDAALILGGILERHALAVFGLMSIDSAVEAARKVWSWVECRKKGSFTKRDCYRGLCSRAFPDVGSIDGALRILIDRSYVFPVPHKVGPGRPSAEFRVNRHLAKEWKQ